MHVENSGLQTTVKVMYGYAWKLWATVQGRKPGTSMRSKEAMNLDWYGSNRSR